MERVAANHGAANVVESVDGGRVESISDDRFSASLTHLGDPTLGFFRGTQCSCAKAYVASRFRMVASVYSFFKSCVPRIISSISIPCRACITSRTVPYDAKASPFRNTVF